MKAYRGSGGVTPIILSLGQGGVSGKLQAAAALTLEVNPQYLLNRRLCGLQRQSGRCGEEKNLLSLILSARSNSTVLKV
jgi:hypothetical protein